MSLDIPTFTASTIFFGVITILIVIAMIYVCFRKTEEEKNKDTKQSAEIQKPKREIPWVSIVYLLIPIYILYRIYQESGGFSEAFLVVIAGTVLGAVLNRTLPTIKNNVDSKNKIKITPKKITDLSEEEILEDSVIHNLSLWEIKEIEKTIDKTFNKNNKEEFYRKIKEGNKKDGVLEYITPKKWECKNVQIKNPPFLLIRSVRHEEGERYTRIQMDDMFADLPIDVQRALQSDDTISFLAHMRKKYKLQEDQSGELSAEIGMLMLGGSSPNNFIPNLEKTMRIKRGVAREIADEVYVNVFSVVEKSLRHVHSTPYVDIAGHIRYLKEQREKETDDDVVYQKYDSSPKCKTCGSKEHHTDDCPHVCKYCGSKEHSANSCSYRPNQDSRETCVYCGSKEHISKHCPLHNSNCCEHCGSKEHDLDHCPNHRPWYRI